MAREVLGIAGAVIGGIYGGPGGAQIGFMIGSGIGAIIDGPEQIKGPALNEAPIQTSRDGVPIPIIWGLHHCHGNIIIKNPETYKTIKTSQGKGGGTETSEQHRYRTFGIGVCRGPIVGISRIWENNKLVYDSRSSPGIPIGETTAYAEGIRIYFGDEDQLPDPDLEAHWGVGDTPYFRGLAYIVWVERDLTDTGGAIPEFRFEVNGSADLSLTSKPYPIEAQDGLQPSFTFPDAWTMDVIYEAVEFITGPEDSTLGGGLIEYTVEAEGFEMTVGPEDSTLGGDLVEYTVEEEAIEMITGPEDSTLGGALVEYEVEEEAVEFTVGIEDSTLTVP